MLLVLWLMTVEMLLHPVLIKLTCSTNYYASTGTVDNGQTPPNKNNVALCSVVETVTFVETEAINKRKPNLSSGPDNLPPLLFKKLKYSMNKPLALLYNQLISVGYVPDSWKKCNYCTGIQKGAAESVTRKPSCRWQTSATLAKSLYGLRKSSGVVSCIARLPIDSLPMVSYYVLYSNCL